MKRSVDLFLDSIAALATAMLLGMIAARCEPPVIKG
jgi:hypothetical protein